MVCYGSSMTTWQKKRKTYRTSKLNDLHHNSITNAPNFPGSRISPKSS